MNAITIKNHFDLVMDFNCTIKLLDGKNDLNNIQGQTFRARILFIEFYDKNKFKI